MDRIALITGATGLVGKALVRLLLDEDYYTKIIILARRDMDMEDSRIEMVLLEDFDRMDEVADKLNAHDVYCALGTTIKQAGSKEKFRKIDVEWPLRLAELCRQQPLFEQFLMVTSHGANSKSPIFYNKVKGEVEDELMKMKLRSLKIFQPSLLLGNRGEFRFWEEAMKLASSVLSFFMIGTKTRLWSIRATEVASAMYRAARTNEPGLDKFSPRRMIKMAA